jgi:hypothetical protein
MIELEYLGMVIFEEGGKTGELEENPASKEENQCTGVYWELQINIRSRDYMKS